MEKGVIQDYHAEGYGFLCSESDRSRLVSFHLSNCNIQTPPPHVGEYVEFSRDATNPLKAAALVRAECFTSTPPAVHQTPLVARFQSPPATTRQRSTNRTSATNASNPRAFKQRQRRLSNTPSFYSGDMSPRYVFVDLDNIWFSFVDAMHILPHFRGATTMHDLELNLEGLTRRFAQGETGSSIVRLVAFYFGTPTAIANRLARLQYDGVQWEVRKQETTTDTTMQLELLNVRMPCAPNHAKTLVLVTGGGNIAPNGMCFREIMDKYLRDGWFVEVHAWLANLASSYIDFQREYPVNTVIRPLDDGNVGEIVRRSRFTSHATSPPRASAPSPCPPQQQPVNGIVTLYDEGKGYGFIRRSAPGASWAKVFFHVTEVHCDVGSSLKRGDAVTFVEKTSGNRVSATLVRLSNEDRPRTANAPNRRRTERSPTRSAANRTPTRNTTQRTRPPSPPPATYEATVPGIIVAYAPDSGIGSIALLDEPTTPNVSFLVGDCDIKHPAPTVGESVMLQVTEGPRGSRASIVRRTDVSAAASTPTSPEPMDQVRTPRFRRPSRTESLFCFICLDDDPIEEIFYIRGCDHTYCRESIRKYILYHIELEDVTPKCPYPDCTTTISDGELTSVLTVEEQEMYYDACMHKAIALDPTLHPCRQDGCRGVASLALGDLRFECPVCHAKHCVQCNASEWHDGIKCEQARQQEREREELEQLREEYRDQVVYECGRCSFGPLELHEDDIDFTESQGRSSNACPRCGWCPDDIQAWPRWSGEFN